MRYDFDIFPIIPDEARLAHQETYDALGIGHITGKTFALFRDPETAYALKNADEAVRTVFEKAGFGMGVYDSGAPEGHYLATDKQERLKAAKAFMSLLREQPGLVSGANWGGIDLRAFLKSIETAKPIDQIDLMPDAAAAPMKQGASWPRRLSQLVLGLSLMFLVFWAQSNLG